MLKGCLTPTDVIAIFGTIFYGCSSQVFDFLQDKVKADAGHVLVEQYISETFSSWASFRPQYMIGSGNNKDCEEWFFDSE